jgi:GT2 family glycosyltransferase
MTSGEISVLVIDNQSTDGSVDHIKSMHPSTVFISTIQDAGYAGNNNFGIATHIGTYDYYFILNEDTVLLDGCIEALVCEMESDSSVGIAGPLVLNESDETTVQSNGGWFQPDGTSGWIDYNLAASQIDSGTRVVDWVHGCSMLIRSDLFERLSGFCSDYYYTWEEVDLCLRAMELGFYCKIVPSAKLIHRDIPTVPSWRSHYYHYRNRYFCAWAHGNRSKIILQFCCDVVKQTVKQMLWSGRQTDSYKFRAIYDVIARNHGKYKEVKVRQG